MVGVSPKAGMLVILPYGARRRRWSSKSPSWCVLRWRTTTPISGDAGRCGPGNVWPLAPDTGVFRLESCSTSVEPVPWSSQTVDRRKTGLEFWPRSLEQNWKTPPSNPQNETCGRTRCGVPLLAWPRPGLSGRASFGRGSSLLLPLSACRVG